MSRYSLLPEQLGPAMARRAHLRVDTHGLRSAGGTYRQSADAVIGTSRNHADSPVVQQAFERARSAEPGLTLDRFLRQAPVRMRALLTLALGADSLAMACTVSGAEMARALAASVEQLRLAHAPYDAGFRASGFVARASEAEQRIFAKALRGQPWTPMDAPILQRAGGALERVAAPNWSQARYRAVRCAGLQLFNRGQSRLRSGGTSLREAFEGVERAALDRVVPDLYGAELRMDGWGAMFMMARGQMPPIAGRLRSVTEGTELATGVRWNTWAVARHEAQARVQLYRLRDEIDLLDYSAEDLVRVRDGLSEASLNMRPDRIDPFGDPFRQMSVRQLFGHALRAPSVDAQVWYNVAELEHHLGQRVTRALQRLCDGMGIAEPVASRLRRAAGLVDPANVHLVSPWQHSMLDFYAGHEFYALRRGLLQGNRRRMDRFGNVYSAGDALDALDPDDLSQAAGAQQAIASSAHPDAPRALNGLMGAQRDTLAEVFELLVSPEARSAFEQAKAADQAAFRGFGQAALEAAGTLYPGLASAPSAQMLQALIQ